MTTTTDSVVEVATRAGRVRGRWREGRGGPDAGYSAAFLGIPFAQAPVGDLRFAAPVPVSPWKGVRDALEFGATAQRGDPGVTLIPEPSVAGESTLNVNVFTANLRADGTPAAAGMPVLVWIHGGGFFAGSPASPWYDGKAFNRDGVVTVSLSYRLGFDGFGWIDGAPSNRGVRDWVAGLEWVQENIAAFGGDPGNVTLAGQSAGGGAVMTLLGMPKAQHLFHAVWSLSGALADVTPARAKALAGKIAAAGGVTSDRDGFASLSEHRLLALQKEATAMTPAALQEMADLGLGLGPTIDGDLLQTSTLESFRAGVGADKPLVMGTTDDEFTMAMDGQEKLLRWVPRAVVLGKMGLKGAARRAYVAANADVARKGTARLVGRYLTDRMFRARLPVIADARGAAPTWAYRFAWPSGSFGYAQHCLDVPFFFDCLDGPAMEPLAGPNPPQALADRVHHDAVSFVRDRRVDWPRWDGSGTARVYDSTVRDEVGAYASVEALR